MPHSPQVLILILNWNGAPHTIRCLESISTCDYLQKHVVVLDNGSKDNSVNELKSALNRFSFTLDILTVTDNKGFVGGINYLLEQYKHQVWDYVFLLNNDALLQPRTLRLLVSFAEKQGRCVVGTSSENDDGQRTFQGKKWPQLLYGVSTSYPFSENLKAWPTDYVEGSGLLMSRVLVNERIAEKSWFFRKDLFLYCEDVELGVWAKNKNIPQWILRDAIIIHSGSASGGGVGNPIAYYYITRNRLKIAQDLLDYHQWLMFLLWTYASRPILILKHLILGRIAVAKAVTKALKDFRLN